MAGFFLFCLLNTKYALAEGYGKLIYPVMVEDKGFNTFY